MIMVCAAFCARNSFASGDPDLGAPVFSIAPGAAQLSLINCGDTNFQYVVQTSTDLQDWMPVTTNFAAGPDSPVAVPATYDSEFYRLMVIPHVPAPLFQYAILTSSNINLNGNNIIVDAFDSSSALYSINGQYSASLRMTNGGDIATDSSIIGDINVGNANIYGHLYTGPGTTQNSVQLGANGAVGSSTWQASNTGIEPGYWSGNFFINYPDIQTPTFVGEALPAPTNGVYNLNGNYTTASSPSAPLNITGPTMLWVQSSFSQGITIATSNNALLILYVGTTNTNNPVSITMSATTTMNSPGYAKNLQIYGLPSLTNIFFAGTTATFVGTIYAPEAHFNGSGGTSIDTSGAIIVKSVSLLSHWNIHYDQNLKVSGPVF